MSGNDKQSLREQAAGSVDDLTGSADDLAGVAPPPAVRRDGERPRAARQRIGFGAPQMKLARVEIEGYHCHWFNDEGSRIIDAQAAWYEFVAPEEIGQVSREGDDISENRVSRVVGADDRGNPIRAFLMKIPVEYWEEDKAASQQRADRIDASIRRAAIESPSNRDDEDKMYVPKGGIELS